MREDSSKSTKFTGSDVWKSQRYDETFLVAPADANLDKGDQKSKLKFVSNSLSGDERNRLFMRHQENFADVSLLSGTDDLADARSHSLLDYDNDGWVDIALMSLNSPRFKIYRNEFGNLFPNNQSLGIRLEGGYKSSTPLESDTKLSNRDGIGAKVLVKYESGKTMLLQKQAGEGFGSQNSSTLRVGIPEGDKIVGLEVQWPSGITTNVDDISKSLTNEKAMIINVKEVQ